MSKYIIEIEEKPLCVFDKDTQTYFPRLWRVKGFNSLVFDEEGLSCLEELNSDYINEHYGELQDEAYRKGLEDAWETARRIAVNMNVHERARVFFQDADAVTHEEPFKSYSAQEAIEKIKAYEDGKHSDRIEVGDEVDWSGDKYIVTYPNYNIETSEIKDYDLLAYDGSVAEHVLKHCFTKTGRHFDIASILEAMRT